jgi:hypothetical protein
MDKRRLAVVLSFVATLVLGATATAAPPLPPPPGADRPAPSSGEASRIEAPDPLVDQQSTDLRGHWTYSRGSTTGPNYIRGADEDPFFAVNPIGYYQGVSSGGGNIPPYAPKVVGGSSAVLTWTGFERGEASSRVFFQLSASVEPEVTVEAQRVVVKLPRTSITTRNNRRDLITRFFNTPVDQVKLKRAGKDVLAILDLRWEATPSWRFEAGANGYQVLILEFSDVQGQTPAPPASTPPPTSAGDQSGEPSPFLPTSR